MIIQIIIISTVSKFRCQCQWRRDVGLFEAIASCLKGVVGWVSGSGWMYYRKTST